MSYASVTGHRSMALDVVRNRAYEQALRQILTPDSIVLDLGAGTGIHGFMAARLGAKRVYLVEPEDIIFVAEEIAAANHLQDTVRCIHGRIEDVRLPEPVDVIVSVPTGNFLLTEDLLETLFHARDTVLRPGGALVPHAARMETVPVSAAELHRKIVSGWSESQCGIDMSPARGYAANTVTFEPRALSDASRLGEPTVLREFDLARETYGPVRVEAVVEIATAGLCHGWAGWFSMKLGDAWLSTSPWAAPMHWSAAFLPLDPPLAFEKGERVTFTLDRAPRGDWTWTTESSTARQQHSTLFSTPINAAALERAALDYVPSLNADGRHMLEVLQHCRGTMSAEAIARSLQAAHPERFAASAEAITFVQRIVTRYS